VFLVLNGVLLALATVVLVPAWVLAEVPGSYGSFGYAAGVHYIAGSDAFPNFEHGAVNNRYPMAEVEQDASPSSAAVATYSDSGPMVATAGSAYNQGCTTGDKPPPKEMCQNPNNQVPYSKSTSPGGPEKSHIDACNNHSPCPAAGADSEAAALYALATGYYQGGATSAQPFSGASAMTRTQMEQSGYLTVISHSEVQTWAMGHVSVSKVTVDVKAVSSLSGGSGEATITGGQVTFNNNPVTVNDQGVTIQDNRVITCIDAPKPPAPPPGVPNPLQPASSPSPSSSPSSNPGPPGPPPPPVIPTLPGGRLGASMASSSPAADTAPTCVPGIDVTYFKFYTVAPIKTIDGSHVTVWATGLHIVVTHPSPGPGVPTQTSEYILGEGFADTMAGTGMGGAAAFGVDFGGFDGFGDFGGGFGGFDANGAGAGPGGIATTLGTALVANRVPLALMFLTLEALLLASAAAWVWARNTPVDTVPAEVLSP
jgi:hypothetical protein